uniref:Proline-rich protein PRCC n=1 Tax=Sipha flava TaxID=143950 RepID=A0A2S2QAL8_9HEMI
MLPDPKNKKTSKVSTTITMVPRATMRKIPPVVKEIPKSQKLEIKDFKSKSTELEEDEVDDDDHEDVDFLGLNKIGEMPDVAPISGFDLPEIKTNTTVVEDDRVYGPVYCPEDGKSDIYEDDETKMTLDSNALKQLGDRDKTCIKQVEVINVNMSQVLEESQQWLQKNLTEEYAESKNVGSDINVTGQSKRKHQITYLAQQAKANELKLKNMWAENRMTRKQTQAKYGF